MKALGRGARLNTFVQTLPKWKCITRSPDVARQICWATGGLDQLPTALVALSISEVSLRVEFRSNQRFATSRYYLQRHKNGRRTSTLGLVLSSVV